MGQKSSRSAKWSVRRRRSLKNSAGGGLGVRAHIYEFTSRPSLQELQRSDCQYASTVLALTAVTVAMDRRKAAVFGGALALRLFLFIAFPSLPDLLTGRVEVSTPINSFKRCQTDYSILILPFMLTIVQYKRVFSSTPTTCHLMMEGSFTRFAINIERRDFMER